MSLLALNTHSVILVSGGGGMVDSVFGRSGNVIALSGDYDSSEVTNLSGVAGATVTAALDNLNGQIVVDSVHGRTGDVVAVAGDYDSDQVDNASGVAGATVSAALDTLEAAIAASSLSVIRGTCSGNGSSIQAGTGFSFGRVPGQSIGSYLITLDTPMANTLIPVVTLKGSTGPTGIALAIETDPGIAFAVRTFTLGGALADRDFHFFVTEEVV